MEYNFTFSGVKSSSRSRPSPFGNCNLGGWEYVISKHLKSSFSFSEIRAKVSTYKRIIVTDPKNNNFVGKLARSFQRRCTLAKTMFQTHFYIKKNFGCMIAMKVILHEFQKGACQVLLPLKVGVKRQVQIGLILAEIHF